MKCNSIPIIHITNPLIFNQRKDASILKWTCTCHRLRKASPQEKKEAVPEISELTETLEMYVIALLVDTK